MNSEKALVVVAALFIVLVVSFTVWWAVYSYQDCKKVGHSTLYCVVRAMR